MAKERHATISGTVKDNPRRTDDLLHNLDKKINKKKQRHKHYYVLVGLKGTKLHWIIIIPVFKTKIDSISQATATSFLIKATASF